jgi:hypothetical protein
VWCAFLIGLFLGTVAGIFVVSLFQVGAKPKDLQDLCTLYHPEHDFDGTPTLANERI